LFYAFSNDNASWPATDEYQAYLELTAEPWQWSFTFSDGVGYYRFFTLASDSAGNQEAPPTVHDAACAYDDAAPTSTAVGGFGYWYSNGTIGFQANASDDASGVAMVSLWARFSMDNASWGEWFDTGVADATPWDGVSVVFTSINGTGHYELYTVSMDNATNAEAAPAACDAAYGYDSVTPASNVNASAPYWCKAQSVNVTAQVPADDLSGIRTVSLYYARSATNGTWPSLAGYTLFSNLTAGPWRWSFNFPGGSGYYRFYTVAADNASNGEAVPSAHDFACVHDGAAPTVVDGSQPEATTGEEYVFTAEVTDAFSLREARVIYWFGAGTASNSSLVAASRGAYSMSLYVPSDSVEPLQYRIVAADEADNWISTATRSVSVIDNDGPTADAGPDHAVLCGDDVAFDGSQSHDDVGIVDYRWTFAYGGSPQALDGAFANFTFSAAGSYDVTLTVEDAAGNSATDTMTVSVSQAPDTQPPTADAGNDRTVTAGTTVTLDASDSSDDSGAVTNYDWRFRYNGTDVLLQGEMANFTFWAPGTYEIELTVVDPSNNTATDNVTVTVTAVVEPPIEEASWMDYWWIIVILAVVVIVVVVMLARRKREDEPEDGDVATGIGDELPPPPVTSFEAAPAFIEEEEVPLDQVQGIGAEEPEVPYDPSADDASKGRTEAPPEMDAPALSEEEIPYAPPDKPFSPQTQTVTVPKTEAATVKRTEPSPRMSVPPAQPAAAPPQQSAATRQPAPPTVAAPAPKPSTAPEPKVVTAAAAPPVKPRVVIKPAAGKAAPPEDKRKANLERAYKEGKITKELYETMLKRLEDL
jgi:hypothetical protein